MILVLKLGFLGHRGYNEKKENESQSPYFVDPCVKLKPFPSPTLLLSHLTLLPLTTRGLRHANVNILN